jgi:hypothetical protein
MRKTTVALCIFIMASFAGAVWATDAADDCASANTINIPGDLPYTDSDTTCGRTNTYDATCTSSYSGGEDAIYELNVTVAGDYLIELTNTATWTGFFVTNGCPDVGTCEDSATSSGGDPAATINFASTGTYYLQIDTWPAPDCTAFDLAISAPPPPPANDDCASATLIALDSFSDAINTVSATEEASEPTGSCGSDNHHHNVWYTFTAVADGTVDIDTCGSSYDTVLRVYTGGCGSFTEVACNDDGPNCSPASELLAAEGTGVAVTNGTQYWIEVAAYTAKSVSSKSDPKAGSTRAGGDLQLTFEGNGTVPVELMTFEVN